MCVCVCVCVYIYKPSTLTHIPGAQRDRMRAASYSKKIKKRQVTLRSPSLEANISGIYKHSKAPPHKMG